MREHPKTTTAEFAQVFEALDQATKDVRTACFRGSDAPRLTSFLATEIQSRQQDICIAMDPLTLCLEYGLWSKMSPLDARLMFIIVLPRRCNPFGGQQNIKNQL
jgi:hypothetical protein